MRILGLLFLLSTTFALEAENTYFQVWKKEIQSGVFIEKNKGQQMRVFTSTDTLSINSYFIYKSTLYVNDSKNTYWYANKKFNLITGCADLDLYGDITWKREFSYYHGFLSILTLILSLPTLFLILLPLALKLANALVGKRKIFHVKFRWFWIALIGLGWFIEYWLRHNPQSF